MTVRYREAYLDQNEEENTMMSNPIKVLKNRYEDLHPNEGCSSDDIEKIENSLDVHLPESFREIALFFRGGSLGGISHFSFIDEVTPNIIQETLRLRDSVNLPHEFIVLAEPPESLIAMDTVHSPSVIWFSAVEVANLPQKEFASPPDEWETYADFFGEFLTEEEEERDY